MTGGRIDVEGLRKQTDLVEVVRRYVPKLRQRGHEHEGLCPFHDERSPSFTVNPAKGFVHCFGCGAHHDLFGFLQRITGLSFLEVVKQLGGGEFARAADNVQRASEHVPEGAWVPLLPVPEDVPELMVDEWSVPIYNPKSGKQSRWKPVRVDAYHNAAGELLGYVLRIDLPADATHKARKWTPQVTWCIGPEGRRQWCLQSFPEPRPLLGLQDLHARRTPTVILFEGEKCRVAGAGALPQYVALAWPGGSNGILRVDWSPLEGRDVVLWPDADEAGRKAMLGYRALDGRFHLGIAQMLKRIRVRSLRLIDATGQPKGWDVADAVAEGWTTEQLGAWAANRIVELDVVRG